MRYCCSLVIPGRPPRSSSIPNAFADPILRGIKSDLRNSSGRIEPERFCTFGLLALIVTLWFWGDNSAVIPPLPSSWSVLLSSQRTAPY